MFHPNRLNTPPPCEIRENFMHVNISCSTVIRQILDLALQFYYVESTTSGFTSDEWAVKMLLLPCMHVNFPPPLCWSSITSMAPQHFNKIRFIPVGWPCERQQGILLIAVFQTRDNWKTPLSQSSHESYWNWKLSSCSIHSILVTPLKRNMWLS